MGDDTNRADDRDGGEYPEIGAGIGTGLAYDGAEEDQSEDQAGDAEEQAAQSGGLFSAGEEEERADAARDAEHEDNRRRDQVKACTGIRQGVQRWKKTEHGKQGRKV